MVSGPDPRRRPRKRRRREVSQVARLTAAAAPLGRNMETTAGRALPVNLVPPVTDATDIAKGISTPSVLADRTAARFLFIAPARRRRHRAGREGLPEDIHTITVTSS